MPKSVFKLLFYCVTFWLSGVAYSQSDRKIDSLQQQLKITASENQKIKILGQLGYEYYTIDPSKTVFYANKAIALAQKRKPNQPILFAYYVRGIGHYMIGKNEEAKSNAHLLIALSKKAKNGLFTGKGTMFLGDLHYEMAKEKKAIGYYKLALYYFIKSNSKEDMAIVYSRIATTYMRFSNYEEGIKSNLKSIKLFQQIKNTRGETTVMRSLGDLYMEMKEYSSAKKMYLQALHISKAIDSTSNSPWIADNLQELGDFYKAVDSLDKAYKYYSRSLSIFKKIPESRGLPPLYTSLGLLFVKKKQYDTALHYFNTSLKMSRNYSDEFDTSANLKNIAQVFLLQQKLPQSKMYLDEALALAIKIDSQQLQLEIYKILSDYHKAASEYEQSMLYLEKHHHLQESIFAENKSKQITGLQIQYNTEQKEQKIKLLNQQNEIQLLTIAKQKFTTELFTQMFLMLLIIAGILFWLFRSKRNAHRALQNKNQEIDQQNAFLENAQLQLKLSLEEKEVLLKEIHHRVKNNLQLVNSLLSIQARDSEKRMDVKEFLTKSQDRVQSMALIHETLYMSGNLATVNFQEYLEKLVHHLFTAFAVDKNAIAVHLETHGILLEIEKVIPLGLILTELINNTLKHAFPNHQGRIEITLISLPEKQLQLRMQDNGIGFPEEYKKASTLGIELVEALIQQLQGDLQVDSHQGTCFTISFPAE